MLLTPLPQRSQLTEKLLLLHGIACTHRVWEPAIQRVANTMGLYAPDLRCHGQSRIFSNRSQEDPSCSMQDYAQDLLTSLGETGFYPCWIVGHSMGARVSVAMAMLRPEWVRGLILVDHPVVSPAQGGEFRSRFGKFLKELPEDFSSKDTGLRYLRDHCPDPTSINILSTSLVSSPDGKVHFDFDHQGILRTFEALPSYPYSEQLELFGAQKKPVMVLRGSQSPFWSEEDWDRAREIFESFPSFEFFQIDQAGHAPHHETPEVFLKMLLDFIQRHGPAPHGNNLF